MSRDWLERAIGEAVDRGEFDDLAGAGEPIRSLKSGYDAGWWAKGFVTRERARDAGIALTAEIGRLLPGLLAERELDVVRDRLDRWNEELRRINEELDVADRFEMLDVNAIAERWASLRR